MSTDKHEFNKSDVDFYLNELAKEIKSEHGRNMRVEIVIVGGAAIMSQYSFRLMTQDIDAEIPPFLKTAINRITDKYLLPNGWLNMDFKKTASYSPKIRLYSKPYKTFSHVLEVRAIRDEYLICMKLKSARQYKRDLSDIVGIVKEMKQTGKDVQYDDIDKAMKNLYGSWAGVPEFASDLLVKCLALGDLESLYYACASQEEDAKVTLINMEEQYPGVINEKNINDVIAQKTDAKTSFLDLLEGKRLQNMEHGPTIIHELDENGNLIIPENELGIAENTVPNAEECSRDNPEIEPGSERER